MRPPDSTPSDRVESAVSIAPVIAVFLVVGAGLMAKRKWGGLLLVACCSYMWLGTLAQQSGLTHRSSRESCGQPSPYYQLYWFP